jgi:30S ribosomal protein S31
MGRGDKRTKKGKIFKGSFGNSRRARVKTETVVAVVKETAAKPAKKAAAPKKAAAKKKAE